MTQAQLAEATGQNLSTIQNLESARYGRGFVRVPGSALIVAKYLGWGDGSVRTVLDGGEPALETKVAEAGRPPEKIFDDPRARQIWLLDLPVEERVQGIRDLFEQDLKRAQAREEEKQTQARLRLQAVRSGEDGEEGGETAG